MNMRVGRDDTDYLSGSVGNIYEAGVAEPGSVTLSHS